MFWKFCQLMECCCKPASAPLPPGLSLCQGPGVALPQPDTYRRLVGQLHYLNLIRQDITHATQEHSKFVAKPTLVIETQPYMS